METFCINIASKRNFDISYVDRYGYRWSLELKIEVPIKQLPAVCMDKLMLNVQVDGSGKPEGNFLIFVEIANDLPLKTITQEIQFKALGLSKSRHISTEIANLRHLQNEGFVTKDDHLELKIGIGPEDPITERNCYQQILEDYRNEICSLKSELADWKKVNVCFFRVEQCPSLESKQSKTVCSTAIMDEHGVKWQLKVSVNARAHKGFLGVSLIKRNGSKGWYDYYIELIHPKAEQHNRIIKGWHLFDDVGLLHLPQFQAMSFLDPFVDGGTLRFRFGTRKEN